MNTPITGKLYDAEISHSFYNQLLTKVTIICYGQLQWDPKIVSLYREQNRCFQSQMTKKEQLKMLDEAFWEVRRLSWMCSVTYSDLATDPGSVWSKTAPTLETPLSKGIYNTLYYRLLSASFWHKILTAGDQESFQEKACRAVLILCL